MKIKSIKKLEEKKMTVDIEVGGTHTYQLSNGWVVHNTVSQLVDSSSGIHPRFSKYYVRTVRSDKTDPIGIFMKEQGIYCEDDVTKPEKTWVFHFPTKSPESSMIVPEITAIQQLEHYLMYYRCWAEHTVSVTIYVKESEWMAVGAWVYDHFDEVGGISFLPYSDHTYQQAPYISITEEEYLKWMERTPKIEWSKFNVDEHQDNTIGSQTLACVGMVCDLI